MAFFIAISLIKALFIFLYYFKEEEDRAGKKNTFTLDCDPVAFEAKLREEFPRLGQQQYQLFRCGPASTGRKLGYCLGFIYF